MSKRSDGANRSMVAMFLRAAQHGPISVARWLELQRRIDDIESRRTQ